MTEPIALDDELVEFLRTRSTLVMSAASDSGMSDLRTVQIKGDDAQVLTLPVVEQVEVERAIADLRAESARVGRVALQKECSTPRFSIF